MDKTRRRQFVCAPEDLNRYYKKMQELIDRWYWHKTAFHMLFSAADHFYSSLRELGIAADDYTREAMEEMEKRPNLYNLHMLGHHVMWQKLDSYERGNPALQKTPLKTIAAWRKATMDCIYKDDAIAS